MHLDIAEMVVWYLVFVFSTTLHEAAHAFVAYRGGDLTAYAGGHVSLDPLPHIRRSPFGMVLVPILSFLSVGWMIGWASVPYDPTWARRYPTRAALMSLAGPMANLLIALVAFALIKVSIATGIFRMPISFSFTHMVALPRGVGETSPLAALGMALSVALNLNVLLGLFNLFPLPPLDGAAVAEGAAPKLTRPFYDWLRQVPMIEILGMVIAWKVFAYLANPALDAVVHLVQL